MSDLKGHLRSLSPRDLVINLWSNSSKNAVAAGYIAGVLDGLRHQKAITVEEYEEFYDRFVYGRG